MKIKGKSLRNAIAIISAAVAVGGVSACGSVSDHYILTPESMCAYLVGKGNQSGGNRTVNQVVWPASKSQGFNTDFDMERYFPCGPRNYVVSPTSNDKDADGQVLLDAHTVKGTEVHVSVTMYWTPNRKDGVIQKFIAFCQKYSCSSDNLDDKNNTNFSTTGWSGMLKENFHPVLQRLAVTGMKDVGEDIWIKDDVDLKNQVAQTMMDNFFGEMQKVSGYTDNLFCGSGSPGGAKDFDCQQVRIVVDKVEAATGDLQTQTNKQIEQQRQNELQQNTANDRIATTDRLYGPLAPQVRACQDLAEKATCVIGGTSVQVVPKQ